jgi:hypothetical protein
MARTHLKKKKAQMDPRRKKKARSAERAMDKDNTIGVEKFIQSNM